MTPSLVPVYNVCRAFGLSRAERLEWATLVLDCNVTSFKQLSPADVVALRHAAEGAAWMARMMRQRRELRTQVR